MIKRLLVPVDFSDVARRAASYAVEELAPQLGAEVVFVTVLEVSDLRVAMSAGLHGFDNDADLQNQIQKWIESQFKKIESGDAKVATKRDIRRGIPEHEIVEAIGEHAPDLVVMGSVGISKRFPLGSKAEHVLRQVDVPVVLIREGTSHRSR